MAYIAEGAASPNRATDPRGANNDYFNPKYYGTTQPQDTPGFIKQPNGRGGWDLVPDPNFHKTFGPGNDQGGGLFGLSGTINGAGGGGISDADLNAANDAVYARAKDEAANTARAALTGLHEELQSRGMGGAGYEAGQIGETLSQEADQIGQASRQNAATRYNQNLTRANVKTQADVATRGQDIGNQENLRGVIGGLIGSGAFGPEGAVSKMSPYAIEQLRSLRY